MNGDSAVAIVANGYAFGAHDFDTATAKTIMRKAADDPNYYNRQGAPVRDKLAQYQAGYVQGVGDSWAWSGNCTPNAAGSDCDDQAGSPPGSGFAPGAGRGYSASETLEYSLDDYALAMFMKATGDPQDQYQPYLDRSGNWHNLFDTQGFPHPRNADGTWVAECTRPLTQLGCFDPKRGNGFDEGTPTEYRWQVPQDLPGLITALGGPAAAKTELDAMLSVMEKGMPMDDHFPVGNEPVIHAPWIYNAMGASSATQYNVRKMIGLVGWDGNPAGRPWTENADGIPGNDDLGEMSSVFAWANLGFYPVTPGTGDLSINGPLFGEMTLTLANGVKVHVTASGAADDAPYIQSLTLDGNPHPSTTLAVSDLLAPPPNGQAQHELAFVMSQTPPSTAWP
jgi:putative alpha-1,2-mannosidase